MSFLHSSFIFIVMLFLFKIFKVKWSTWSLFVYCAQQVRDQLKPFLKDLFYDSGPKNCIPKCPMDVIPWFHGHATFHSYFIGNKDCSYKASQGLPFFVENYGPKWTEYTTSVHEFSGHHVEV